MAFLVRPSASVLHQQFRGGLLTPPCPSSSPCYWRLHAQREDNKEEDRNNNNNNDNNKVLDFLLDPYETKIPKEMQEEIYRAEGNTAAAQERNKRVTLYGILAISLVACAFFNGFLTELRHSEIMQPSGGQDATVMTLEDLGFGWVQANTLFRFVFLNKIGGGLALVSGAASGMLAEAELDSRRKNAERIWAELERRRQKAEQGGGSSQARKNKAVVKEARRRKKSGKQAKRMGALSEVMLEEPKAEPIAETMHAEPTQAVDETTKEDGVMDKLKGWYEKADSMAASQALLLNKNLEEKGIVQKITDESGLKVIGKEAAAKLQTESESQKDTIDTAASRDGSRDGKTN